MEMDSKSVMNLSQMTFVTCWMWGSKMTPKFIGRSQMCGSVIHQESTTWRRKSMGERKGRSPATSDAKDVPKQ